MRLYAKPPFPLKRKKATLSTDTLHDSKAWAYLSKTLMRLYHAVFSRIILARLFSSGASDFHEVVDRWRHELFLPAEELSGRTASYFSAVERQLL